jgi:hypothetical protein
VAIESFLFSEDPEAGRKTIFHYDHATDEIFFETKQEVDPLLEYTKANYNATDERARWGDGQIVAEIPAVIWGQMLKDGRAHDPAAIRAWVNSPDNRMFRTRPGKV